MILGFISLFFSGESGRNEFATIPGMKLRLSVSLLVLVAAFAVSGTVAAFGQTQKQTQKEDTPTPMQKAPSRSEGEGPYPHLTLRNVTLIDGTGAPPVGPVDIIIEKNRIVAIQAATASRTTAKVQPGDREMNLAGMYVLPGFINAHTHIGPVTSIPAEYIYKLWMAHGISRPAIRAQSLTPPRRENRSTLWRTAELTASSSPVFRPTSSRRRWTK